MAAFFQFGGRLPSKRSVNGIILANLCGLLLMLFVPTDFSLPTNIISITKVACIMVSIHCLLLSVLSMENWKLLIVKQVKAAVKGICILIPSCLFFHLLAVCFGAPFLTETAETFHFAMLLTCCTVLPGVIALGNSFSLWIKVYTEYSPDLGCELVAFILSFSSILGAWMGAFPIPLDWDRSWQVWPVSCVIGTLAGYSFGLVASSIILFYQLRLAHNRKPKSV